ncbi:MAG: hypothetical protein OEZ65_01320 [Gemmatimonadota bacterium]|nr:hypothetical protein [Gemmatimonadota bacterium]
MSTGWGRCVLVWSVVWVGVPACLEGQDVASTPPAPTPVAFSLTQDVAPGSPLAGDALVRKVRLLLADTLRLRYPEAHPRGREVEALGSARVRRDPADSAGVWWSVAYPLTVWETGDHTLPGFELRVEAPDGSWRRLVVPPVNVTVSSPLPPGALQVRPAAPEGLPELAGGWWTLPLWVPTLLMTLGGAGWIRARGGRSDPDPSGTPASFVARTTPEGRIRAARAVADADPAEAAVLAARALRDAGVVGRGETTHEFVERGGREPSRGARDPVARTLMLADRVLYEGSIPTAEEVTAALSSLLDHLDPVEGSA